MRREKNAMTPWGAISVLWIWVLWIWVLWIWVLWIWVLWIWVLWIWCCMCLHQGNAEFARSLGRGNRIVFVFPMASLPRSGRLAREFVRAYESRPCYLLARETALA